MEPNGFELLVRHLSEPWPAQDEDEPDECGQADAEALQDLGSWGSGGWGWCGGTFQPRTRRPGHITIDSSSMDSASRGMRHSARERLVALITPLGRASRPLTVAGLLLLAVAAVTVVGIVVDERTITGAPAWLKPFKFAISTAIYSLTLAWIFGWLSDWPRVRAVVGWTTAIVLVGEVAIISLQAWRGTTSHFNVATRLDGILFSIMGVGIMIQTLASVAVAVALWRHQFADRTLGWALRLGMTLTILGAMTGPLMTRPTAAQLAQARSGGGLPVVGSHSVGGVDGGPGLPITGWSREHGDVRVPHFVGLHAIQALALLALFLRRWRRPDSVRFKALLAGAASYYLLFAVLLWQALRGRSVVPGGVAELLPLAIWSVLTALALGWVLVGARPLDPPAMRSSGSAAR